ncbi:hypothetical protein Q1695_005916 [Nippostrongylus brasiliensis]|nr:hypothetical protein Q1695_005916 [Nippostrongylus brasiliensis]
MIVGTFAWGALQLNATKEQNVLIIGSAGGVISNFLSSLPNQKIAVTSVEIDSVMKEIAERWFDFDESPSHQLIIEDGVDYVRKAADKGIKYDAILLDVNHNSELPLLAPVEAFLASDVIRNMRRILSSSGTAVVNIITLKPEYAAAYAHEIKRLFNEQFPSCYVKSQGFTERMLFCPADISNSWEMNASEIRRRYAEAKEAFKFELA